MLFLYDANDKGVKYRVKQFQDRCAQSLGVQENFQNGKWCKANNAKAAVFVFTALGSDKGTLEDTLLALFKSKNESLVSEAQGFVEDNFERSPNAAGQPPAASERQATVAKKNKAILTVGADKLKRNWLALP